jgi:pyruvate/2-oxoglutarate/acetoin dehydrogenase E1 component
MREWILENAIASENELNEIEENSKIYVRDAKTAAWSEYLKPIKLEVETVISLFNDLSTSSHADSINSLKVELNSIKEPIRKDIIIAVKKVLRLIKSEKVPARNALILWLKQANSDNLDRYSSHLYSESNQKISAVSPVNAEYEDEKLIDGRELLRENFDFILNKYPEVLIFGEDSGKIGGVNQGLEGLQLKYGEHRVFDTGIREATIMGQAIGLAMRGLRPIAEIQYLDYLLYALQIMSDDLATVHWRTKGRQKSPVIIRTRGHRLEGVWHSGSPMAMIVSACRGINICVPRNMTQAAGFYNLLLEADEPALVIEPLNGYRLKEKLPSNIGTYKVQLGLPETLIEGSDVTLVTYGSSVRIAQEAIKHLNEHGISVELIDVQTLLPFDINHFILNSIKKTNRVVFFDEDVEGGGTAYMMQKVIEEQEAYQYLDSKPITLASKPHRPAYGSDGDYFSKPSADDVFDVVYNLMLEVNPTKFDLIY